MSATACMVFDMINSERKRNGYQALRISQGCVQAAQSHAEDMDRGDFMSHDHYKETELICFMHKKKVPVFTSTFSI